jgi:hypothetical protein
MPYTDTVTFDNLSFHAVTAPIVCRKIILREVATDASPTPVSLAAPLDTNVAFQLAPLETVTFDAGEGKAFEAGTTAGYIKPLNGTVTFSRLCQ